MAGEPKQPAQDEAEDEDVALTPEEQAIVEKARQAFRGRQDLPKASRKLQDRMQSESGGRDD